MLAASGIGAEYAALMMMGRMGEPSNNIQVYSAYQKMKKEWKNTVYLARSVTASSLVDCRVVDSQLPD